jgi:hypothetical protein
MKLDMADKYPPAEDFDDDEPTIRMNAPYFFPKIIVSEDGHTVEVVEQMGSPEVVEDFRKTIPSPPSETTYPGVGLLLAFGTGFIFWGAVAYIVTSLWH